jgi:hypothetical protein
MAVLEFLCLRVASTCFIPLALKTTTSDENYNDLINFFGVSGCGKTRAVVEMLAQT